MTDIVTCGCCGKEFDMDENWICPHCEEKEWEDKRKEYKDTRTESMFTTMSRFRANARRKMIEKEP